MCPHTDNTLCLKVLNVSVGTWPNLLDELFLSAAGLDWIWGNSSSIWSASKGAALLLKGLLAMVGTLAGGLGSNSCPALCFERLSMNSELQHCFPTSSEGWWTHWWQGSMRWASSETHFPGSLLKYLKWSYFYLPVSPLSWIVWK